MKYDPSKDPRATTLCGCGCGRFVREKTDPRPREEMVPSTIKRWAKMKYRHGHRNRNRHLVPIGSQRIADGYVLTSDPEYKGSKVNKWFAREARRVASKALGRDLPSDAYVFHLTGDKADNVNIAVGSRSYVRVLHHRRVALEVCGHAWWRKCSYCGEYDAPNKITKNYMHPSCAAEKARLWRAKKKN